MCGFVCKSHPLNTLRNISRPVLHPQQHRDEMWGGNNNNNTAVDSREKKKQEKRPNLFVKHFFFFSPFDSKYGIMFKGAYIYSKRECHTVKSQHRTSWIRQRAGKKKKFRTGNLFWQPTRECRWFVIFGAVHNSRREKKRRIRLGGGALPIMVARLTSRRRTVTHTERRDEREMTLYYPYVITWVNLM